MRGIRTAPGSDEGVTTLVLRGLPPCLSREHFIQDLDQRGFWSLYDFVYLPKDFNTKRCKGYAFVNFRRQEDARRFARTYDGAPSCGPLPGQEHSAYASACAPAAPASSASAAAGSLHVGVARLQGFQQNVEAFLGKRRHWTRDMRNLPLIFVSPEHEGLQLSPDLLPDSVLGALPPQLRKQLGKAAPVEHGPARGRLCVRSRSQQLRAPDPLC